MYFSIIQTNNSSFTIVCWWSSLIANSMSVFRDVAFLFILRSLGSLNQSIQRCGRWIPKPRWRILWSTPSIISLLGTEIIRSWIKRNSVVALFIFLVFYHLQPKSRFARPTFPRHCASEMCTELRSEVETFRTKHFADFTRDSIFKTSPCKAASPIWAV